MSFVMPYLGVIDDAGGVVDVFNNCRTMAYIESFRPAGWRAGEGSGCEQCCCARFDNGPYTDLLPDGVPWADADLDASLEVWGFLIDHDGFEIELNNSTRLAAEGGAVRATISGTVISHTRRGHNYFVRWLTDFLDSGCGGLKAQVWEHCDDAGPFVPLVDVQPPVDRTSPGGDPAFVVDCPTVDYVGSGRREYESVELVSFDRLDDGDTGPHCAGDRYVIVLDFPTRPVGEILSDCTIDGPWDAATDCEPGPIEQPTGSVGLPCELCGVPCRCLPTLPVVNVGGTIPIPTAVPSEPDAFAPVVPKPVVEAPPPSCPPATACALANAIPLDIAGFVTPPPAGQYLWFAGTTGVGVIDNWLDYLACTTGNSVTSIIAACDAAGTGFILNGTAQIDVLVGGSTRIAPISTFLSGICDDFCVIWTMNPPGTNVAVGETPVSLGFAPACAQDNVPVSTGPNPLDASCLFGLSCYRPTLDGVDYGENIFPFPLEWEGTVYNTGPEFATAMGVARGCAAFWNDENHPTDPCTYCIPNDCPRGIIADLVTPPSCVKPTLDGVVIPGGQALVFPLVYAGIEFADGPDLASYLTIIRGCTVTWDATNDTYCLPSDCPRGLVINLTTPALVVDDDCWQFPTSVVRRACLVPAVPAVIDREMIIDFSNPNGRLENARIRIYEFIDGVEHVLNQVTAPYAGATPIVDYRITGMAAASSLTIDGTATKTSLTCFDDSVLSTSGVLEGPDRSPASMPDIRSGCYWVEVLLSCDVSSDGNGFGYGAEDSVVRVRTVEVFD